MEIPAPEELKRTCQNTHITALQLYNNFLLIAESNEVQIYNWTRKHFIQKEIIFNSCSIHGIRIGDDQKVLFFGAKSIKILSIDENCNKCQVKTVAAVNLDDWILDAQWLYDEGKLTDSIAAITAHNCLTIFTPSHGILQSIHCAENCILYSASIISCKLNSLVLAVGTVFRKILLWSPNSELEVGGRKIPFNQMIGHQGVIFSVTYKESQNIICSTSDDRSLRVWKVQSDEKEEKGSFKYWEKSIIDNIYVLFAHESRVWRSAILDSCILSIGEDSFLCVWSLSGKLLKKIKCHKGGSIWCLETTKLSTSNKKSTFEHEDTLFAFTGGSDGGVYIWDISKASQPELISQVHLHNSNTFVKDFPRVCALLTDAIVDNFIVSTDKGRISKYNMKLKIWQDIFYEDSFASYCIVSVSNGNSLLAMGNISGNLVLMKLQGDSAEKCASKKFEIHDSKICSLHWVNRTNDILLSCSTEGRMALWKISYESEFTIHCMHRFSLLKCKSHWWTTAALFLSCHNILVVGDRSGTVSVYNHSCNSTNNDLWDHPSMTHRNIHGDNGVTDIQKHSSFVYSAGRDGKVNQYIVKDGTLRLLHCIKVSHDLEWIGKILFYDDHLLLLGFHTKDFVVWSTQLESSVMTVECGGGHRSWDFSLTDNGMATYVAIKKKEIIYYQQNLHHVLKESVLKAGISGQKFSCLTYLYTKPYNAGSMSVVACGGEDNAVRIIGIIDVPHEPSKIAALNSLSGHLSSIRAIGKSSMLKTDEYLLASVGGRSQIIVWKLTAHVKNLQCEELISDILSNSEKKVKMKLKENQIVNIDPQTRLMDVSIVHDTASQIDAESFIIGVACSDSFFRLYKFDVNKKELLLNRIFKHGENCIQKLRTVSIKTSILNSLYMTGATNGSLKLLCSINDCHNSSSSVLSDILLEDIHCHKSGMNALDVKFVTDSIIMACSGGDDNSLTITFVSIDLFASDSSKVKVLSQIHKLDAHASQITGVKILDQNTIVSASIDQRINLWKISYRHSVELNLHTSALSLIPDIANLECWQSRNSCWTVAVCGQGIEILNITIKENEDYLMEFENFFTKHICIKNV